MPILEGALSGPHLFKFTL